MEDEAGLACARPGGETGEIDAVMMDDGAIGREARGERLSPDRFRDGDEQVAAFLQPALQQGVAHPGEAA
jgi:hypothetical protein